MLCGTTKVVLNFLWTWSILCIVIVLRSLISVGFGCWFVSSNSRKVAINGVFGRLNLISSEFSLILSSLSASTEWVYWASGFLGSGVVIFNVDEGLNQCNETIGCIWMVTSICWSRWSGIYWIWSLTLGCLCIVKVAISLSIAVVSTKCSCACSCKYRLSWSQCLCRCESCISISSFLFNQIDQVAKVSD